MRDVKEFACMLVVVLFASCGGQSGDGQIALQIENARGPAGISALNLQPTYEDLIHVDQFKVTISGEGIDPSIVMTADASATEIEVLNIPPGVARTILIEAFNADDTVIRRRRLDDIEIISGVVTPIKTSLNTIPIILNLKPGSVVLTGNLHVLGFGEPGGSIKVDASSALQSISLNESVDGNSVGISPDISTGFFDLLPTASIPGKQTLTLTDEENGESSSLDVYVVEGRDRPGRRFVSTGGLGPAIVLGSGWGGVNTVNFPKVLQALAGKPMPAKK